MVESEIKEDWDEHLSEYRIEYPFGDFIKAIRIDEDDVDDELLSECVEHFIVSEVDEGYFITHENIEKHCEVINERGLEAYLEKRLELVEDE